MVAPTPALWAASIGCLLLYNEIHHTDLYVQHWVRDGIYNLAMLAGLALSLWHAGRRQSNAGRRAHG